MESSESSGDEGEESAAKGVGNPGELPPSDSSEGDSSEEELEVLFFKSNIMFFECFPPSFHSSQKSRNERVLMVLLT